MGADSRMLEPQSSLPDLGNEGISHVPPFCAEENIRHQKDTALSLDLAKKSLYVSRDSPESDDNHLGKVRPWWDKPWMKQFSGLIQ